MKTKLFNYLILVIIVIGMNSCGKANSYLALGSNTGVNTTVTLGANDVWMQNTTFAPSTKTISAGTTITWTNKDATTHDVTSSTGLFGSSALSQNGTFSFTFTTAGTYNYHCTFHAGMNGTIIVQ